MATITNYPIKELIAFRRIEKNWGKFTIYDLCDLITLGVYRPIQFLDGDFFKPNFSLTLYDIALIEIAKHIILHLTEDERPKIYRLRRQYAKLIISLTEKLSKMVIAEHDYCVVVFDCVLINYIIFTSEEQFKEKLSSVNQEHYYIFNFALFIRRLDKTIKK